jgi:hypothetical protein
MEFAEGMRVRVAPHPFWPDGAGGTVRPFPRYVAELCGGADGCSRVFRGTRGPITMVWVVFDKAVRGCDGDGPYHESEIMAEYLELVE